MPRTQGKEWTGLRKHCNNAVKEMGSHFLIFFKENLHGKLTLRGSDLKEKADRLDEIVNVELGVVFGRLGKKVHVIFLWRKNWMYHILNCKGWKSPPPPEGDDKGRDVSILFYLTTARQQSWNWTFRVAWWLTYVDTAPCLVSAVWWGGKSSA